MEYAIAFVAGTVVTWLLLLVVVPVAQRLADFSFPPWSESLWKLAVVAAAYAAVNVALTPVHWFLAAIAAAIVFFILMVKWFDVDMFGAIMIVVAAAMLERVIGFMVVMAMFSSAMGG